ncbi:MAG TPA: PTS sugar transporter subunit IIB [Gemmatimonadota bacterium]|nr:PTS sugar transporter subunit IIB [Gemmatimonadota bacterium]
MSVVLFRVDERLIHGQVVLGWARRFDAERVIVVDDELAAEPLEQEIYRTGLPAGLESLFWNEADAVTRLPAVMESDERVFVLTGELATMWRLAVGGVPIAQVNIGGLHAGPGRRRILPYVCLDADDERRIGDLEAAGVRVVAQDVPTAAPVRLYGVAR